MASDPPGSGHVEAGVASADAIAAVVREFIQLTLQHFALAGAELAESGAGLGWAAALSIIAFLVGFVGLILLCAGGALALALVLPSWAAFLLVGGAILLAAGGLFLFARAQSRRCTLVPERAIASLRQNLSDLGEQWR
jgi:putative superfamily III holin-X